MKPGKIGWENDHTCTRIKSNLELYRLEDESFQCSLFPAFGLSQRLSGMKYTPIVLYLIFFSRTLENIGFCLVKGAVRSE